MAPHLEVRRPSPTTVEFTVTTQPRRVGWTGRGLTVLVVVLRVLLAASAGLVFWAWLTLHVPAWTEGAQPEPHEPVRQHENHQPRQPHEDPTCPSPWLEAQRQLAQQLPLLSSPSLQQVREGLAGVLATLVVGGSRENDSDTVSTRLHARAPSHVHMHSHSHSHTQPPLLPPWLLLPLCAVAAAASVARVHTSESLLVLRGLGIQTRSSGATYIGELVSALALAWWTLTSPWSAVRAWMDFFGGSGRGGSRGGNHSMDLSSFSSFTAPTTTITTRFIPTEKLQDLLVNEAFRGFEVRYYLVAVVGTGGRGFSAAAAAAASGGGGGGDSDGEGMADAAFREGDAWHEGADIMAHGAGERDGEDEDGDGYDSQCNADEEDRIVVVFPKLLPGLDIVRTVWREARACLYEPDETT